MNFVVRSLVAGAGAILGCYAIVNAADMTSDCRIGIYRLSDNSDVDIAPSDEGRLRWRRKDGTSGALSRNPTEAGAAPSAGRGDPMESECLFQNAM